MYFFLDGQLQNVNQLKDLLLHLQEPVGVNFGNDFLQFAGNHVEVKVYALPKRKQQLLDCTNQEVLVYYVCAGCEAGGLRFHDFGLQIRDYYLR